MPYIPPEVVEQARQIDLLTYLQSCEPQELEIYLSIGNEVNKSVTVDVAEILSGLGLSG